jgi:glutamate-ammonia-ligase adenylyltransferase
VFQLIRGGRDPALQIKPTLQVLRRLADSGLLSRRGGGRTFRRLRLPAPRRTPPAIPRRRPDPHAADRGDADRAIIARAMGYGSFDGLLAELDDHRANVARHFEAVFADPNRGEHKHAGMWRGAGGEDQGEEFAKLGYRSRARRRRVSPRCARGRATSNSPPASASASMPWCRS